MFAALALTLSLIAPAQVSQPSFNCARATTVVERAICGDAELGRLDRQMANRFAAVRVALDPATRATLLEDQRQYLWVRDEQYRTIPARERVASLREDIRARIDFLEAIETRPRAGVIGYWSNNYSTVYVTPGRPGWVRVQATAAEPLTARWTCDFDVNARLTSGGARGTTADTPDTEFGSLGWIITLQRRGVQLNIEECCSAGFCGNGGTISGDYLPIRGAPSPGWRDYES
jgi:uncharacterized protein YecT (DUF1311 family)